MKLKQSVADGIAPPGNGPFTITDSYGRTAITANGDGVAVSPNINQDSRINTTNRYPKHILKLPISWSLRTIRNST
jgi:hypothetical protein